MIEVATGAKQRFDIKTTSFRISPDNKFIAAGLRDADHWPRSLVVLDLATKKTRQLHRVKNQASSVEVSDWSPDGQSILTEFFEKGAAAQIALVSARDGSVRVLKTFETNSFPSSSTYSPDGRWIAYNSSQQLMGKEMDIHLLAADGSSEVPVVLHPASDQLLGWSPFGDRILFASDRRGSWDAYTIQVVDGKPVGAPSLLKEGIGKVRQSLGFTRHGAYHYVSETHASEVYVATLDVVSGKVQGTPSKAASIEGSNQYPAWSRNGRLLAYVSRRGVSRNDSLICIRDIETGNVRELSTNAGYVAFPQWSPDARSLLALGLRSEGGFACRIEAESGKSTVIAKDGLSIILNAWPMWSWTTDSKSFYNQSSMKTITRHDLDTGGRTEFPIPRNIYSSVLSPNCEQIAFSTSTKTSNVVVRTIHVAPLSGGTARQLLELTGLEAIENLTGRPDTGLGWTPDGGYVLFVKGTAKGPRARALWRVPVAGGPPEPLGWEMEELREPVISPDGRRIAFTAGGNKKELWVMENFLPKDNAAAK